MSIDLSFFNIRAQNTVEERVGNYLPQNIQDNSFLCASFVPICLNRERLDKNHKLGSFEVFYYVKKNTSGHLTNLKQDFEVSMLFKQISGLLCPTLTQQLYFNINPASCNR